MGISRRFLLIAAPAMFAGCASTPSASPGQVRTSSLDFITSIEVDATPVANAYDLVSRLRPGWLQGERQASIGSGGRMQVIAVYLDGVRMGGLSSLRAINTSGVKSLQYYDASRAATVLRDPGSEPIAGAIVVTTSRP